MCVCVCVCACVSGFKKFITDMEYMLDVKIKFVRFLFFVFVYFLPATLFVSRMLMMINCICMFVR